MPASTSSSARWRIPAAAGRVERRHAGAARRCSSPSAGTSGVWPSASRMPKSTSSRARTRPSSLAMTTPSCARSGCPNCHGVPGTVDDPCPFWLPSELSHDRSAVLGSAGAPGTRLGDQRCVCGWPFPQHTTPVRALDEEPIVDAFVLVLCPQCRMEHSFMSPEVLAMRRADGAAEG